MSLRQVVGVESLGKNKSFLPKELLDETSV